MGFVKSGIKMSNDIYLLYYNGKFLGMLSDSESFWYLYEWLSESDGVCNVVTISKDMVDIPDDIQNFNELIAEHGEVEISRSTMSVRILYDDNLI